MCGWNFLNPPYSTLVKASRQTLKASNKLGRTGFYARLRIMTGKKGRGHKFVLWRNLLNSGQGLPLKFYFRGHKILLTLSLEDIWCDFGDRYIPFNTKLSNFRGHDVPLESKFRGYLKQKRAKSPFFEGQGKP